MKLLVPVSLILALSGAVFVADVDRLPQNPLIDFEGFLVKSREALEYREQRRLTEDRFLSMAQQPDTVVLDSRSADGFARLHVAGAVNLPFSDFTEEALSRMIPNKRTRILIYCNNNFAPSPAAMLRKKATMALNIPTFTNLLAYGYENVYELGPVLDPATTRLELVGDRSIR